MWRRRGETYADSYVRQASRWGGGSIMIWGGISWSHKTELLIVEESITARRYIDEAPQPEVVLFFERHYITAI